MLDGARGAYPRPEHDDARADRRPGWWIAANPGSDPPEIHSDRGGLRVRNPREHGEGPLRGR